MLESGRVRHVTDDVVGEQLEMVGRAVGELVSQPSKQLVQFLLPESIELRTQHAHRFVAGPDGSPRPRIAVMDRHLRVIDGRPHPGQKIFTISHERSMLPTVGRGERSSPAEHQCLERAVEAEALTST